MRTETNAENTAGRDCPERLVQRRIGQIVRLISFHEDQNQNG
jgi:hypothetical protein